MTIPLWHVDAFAGKIFTGNPAGVRLLDRWLAASFMLSIAAENDLPETAFVVQAGEGFELRWFTPSVEVDLCGHATLAAAHVLFHHRSWQASSITFSSQSGPLVVEKKGEVLVLDFPARPPLPCEPVATLLKGLGAKPLEVLGARDYLAVFATEEEVRRLAPDMALLARIDRMGVIATAPGSPRPGEPPADFVSRFFAPGVGIPEDPVTGSSHCTLIPYWAKKLRRTILRALQVSPRGGELFCEDAGGRVKIGGRAVTYLAGEIEV